LLEVIAEESVTVSHKETVVRLAVPNWIARHRAETFAFKEPETLQWIEEMPRGAVLWDIGANVGLYSIYAAKSRDCNVFAFEPSVFNLELLARNVALNDLQHAVTMVPIPLSGGTGVNRFQLSTTSWGGALSTFAQGEEHIGVDHHGKLLKPVFEYAVASLSMDQARDRLELPQPTHIKLDVDGIEHVILAGGASVLSRVDSVLVEINDSFLEQATNSARHLQSAGLSLKSKADAGPGLYNQLWGRDSKGGR
jgi:FkbM family methyltransferase